MKQKLQTNLRSIRFALTGSMMLSAASFISAQTYSFEDSALPANWSVENGKVSFTTEHSTVDNTALTVEVAAGQTAVITCPFPTPKKQTNAKYNFHVEIYSKEVTHTPFTVNFYDEEGGLHLSGNGLVNFKGWMPYYRSYVKDYGENGMTKKAAKMTIAIDNSASAESVELCFDNWKLDASLSSVMALPVNVKDVGMLANQTQQPLMLYSFFANAAGSATLASATAEEKSAISTLKNMFPQSPDATDSDIEAARTFVKALNITRNTDGTVKSGRIISAASAYTLDNQVLVLRHLNALAASPDQQDAKMFSDFMDAVLDANIFYRFKQLQWHVYADVRLVPRLMLALIPKMSDSQVSEWLKPIRWIVEEGWSHAPIDYFSTKYNSDILYLAGGSNYYLNCAINDPDPDVAARELRSFKKLLELVLTPVSGGYEIMKPDGCGFHHGVHYNNYMYAFNPWVNSALILKDTPFCVDNNAYNQIKKAILTCYAMSTRSHPYSNPDDPTDPTRNLYAKSLAGRHPFDGGQVNQFDLSTFGKAVDLSSKFYGGTPDPELAAAYNYYTMTNTYNVAEKDFSGFYQFNYSPIGIYRTHDWVVTMRCPTTAAWGAEIYANKNRFGRYQSTGSMEVMYNGRKANSGMPLVASGYDWNVVPGTTTVHYSDWRSMLPNGNLSSRFDQVSENTDYSGALAWNLDKCGMFSCEYEQSDTHYLGTRCYPENESTHLKFRKTILAIDGMLFNLGSDISTLGEYSDSWITATNLFQEVGEDLTDFNVNGRKMTRDANPMVMDCSTENVWLVSPKGTGFIVPKGNRDLVVKYGLQEGPHGDGNTYDTNPEKAVGAKAYIQHGVKVGGEKYSYIMLPGTSAGELGAKADAITAGFEPISNEGTLHGIIYKPKGITALSFFAPVDDTGLEFVKSSSSQMLAMYQKQSDGSMALALCCPNLHPNRLSNTLCDWTSAGSQATVTLQGEWKSSDSQSKDISVTSGNGITILNVNFNDGLPVYLNLNPISSGIYESRIGTSDVKAYSRGKDLIVELAAISGEDVGIEVNDLNGVTIAKSSIQAGNQTCVISGLSGSAMNIVRIVSNNGVKNLKVLR